MASAEPQLTISCTTDTYAYPLDADYKPIVRVYESPYKSGDCPIIEEVLGIFQSDGTGTWALVNPSTDLSIAINERRIDVLDFTREILEENKDYEIRIYQSDELVQREE